MRIYTPTPRVKIWNKECRLCMGNYANYYLKFEVLTVVKIPTAVFWVVMLCSLVSGYQHFGRRYRLQFQGSILKVDMLCSSETLGMLGITYKTTWHHNPEDHKGHAKYIFLCFAVLFIQTEFKQKIPM
jgi:hypothetical protein